MSQFDVYELLEQIRKRPPMYLGEWSLVRLEAFLNGCFYLADQQGIERVEQPEFRGLHDWTATRFGWSESTAGWRNIITAECGGDDKLALQRFFELLDEYRSVT